MVKETTSTVDLLWVIGVGLLDVIIIKLNRNHIHDVCLFYFSTHQCSNHIFLYFINTCMFKIIAMGLCRIYILIIIC